MLSEAVAMRERNEACLDNCDEWAFKAEMLWRLPFTAFFYFLNCRSLKNAVNEEAKECMSKKYYTTQNSNQIHG